MNKGTAAAERRIGIVVQGPIHTALNNHATREVLERLNASAFRDRFFVVYSAWEDEPKERLATVESLADVVLRCRKPERAGSCHRNFQAHAVSEGVKELERRGIRWALKTRSDVLLSDKFLQRLTERTADPDYDRVLVTNLFTRYEPFHISDLVVFSSTPNLRMWFDPTPVFYEDLYSPEVQFARVFIRARRLAYPLTLSGYFRFMRDWIELVDFYEEGLFWFKEQQFQSIRAWNAINFVMYDRDMGPHLTRLMSVPFHRSLQGKVKGLTLKANRMLIVDAFQRYVFTTVPGFRRKHCLYTVDNRGTEHNKVVNTSVPVRSPLGEQGAPTSPPLVEVPVPAHEPVTTASPVASRPL